MNFSLGQIIFALSFAILFIIGLIWAYRKDMPATKRHFKNIYVILITIVLVFFAFWLFVKLAI